ncbi:MAG: hypothetical protein V3S24_10825, partial [Candidatus Tectomicrobia bacterium]
CGTPGSPTDSISTMAKWVVKEVRKRSGGRIEGRVFPASQVGNNIQMIEQLQLGTLECTGKKWWDKLPSDLQKTLREVFREAERVTWERGQEIDKKAIRP